MPTKDDERFSLGGQEAAQTSADTPLCEQAEFLAKISHEIRTPLNAIMGYAEILHKTNLDAKQQHYAGNILKSSLALVELLNTWLIQAKDPTAKPGIQAQPAVPSFEVPVPAQDKETLKILVVEDSSMIRDLFMDIFSDDHLTILTASSGAKALDIAVAELPQLIFLDLHLPDTDGWQVAKGLRSNQATAAIPLIAMTGQFLKKEEYSCHFDEFLQKPFQLKQLRSMVDSWLHTLRHRTTSSVQTLPEPADEPSDNTQQELAQCLQPHWNIQLSKLLAAVSHTGSLFVTIELGKCLQTVGQEQNCGAMEQVGSQLVRCASAPDITGVEEIITRLTPLLQVRHL